MEPLENLCTWKVQVNKKRELDKDYSPKGPFFICLYNCDGNNKSCGGYIKYEEKKEYSKKDY